VADNTSGPARAALSDHRDRTARDSRSLAVARCASPVPRVGYADSRANRDRAPLAVVSSPCSRRSTSLRSRETLSRSQLATSTLRLSTSPEDAEPAARGLWRAIISRLAFSDRVLRSDEKGSSEDEPSCQEVSTGRFCHEPGPVESSVARPSSGRPFTLLSYFFE